MEINREILKNIGKRNNYQQSVGRSFPAMQSQSLNSLFEPMSNAERLYYRLEPDFLGKTNGNINAQRFYTANRFTNDEDPTHSDHGTIDDAEQQQQLQQQPDQLTPSKQQQPQTVPQPPAPPQQHQQQRQQQLYDDDESVSQKFDWNNY